MRGGIKGSRKQKQKNQEMKKMSRRSDYRGKERKGKKEKEELCHPAPLLNFRLARFVVDLGVKASRRIAMQLQRFGDI